MRNVLVIMSDEHQRRALGSMGHPIVQTPNLDALAATGTTFTNCWTPSPICVPARGAFATGRWVHEVGTWDSAVAYAGEPTGWTHLLRDHGYDVVSFGKLHHRSNADDDGFSERVLPMNIVGGVGWLQGLPRREPIPYDEAHELAADVGIGETTYTRYDRRITDEARNWLADPARHDGPWTAFVSLVAPHYPLSAPEDFAALYPIDEVPPPEIGPVTDEHSAVAAMRTFFRYGDFFDDERVAQARAAYFALCSFMDHNVGLVLDALTANGLRDDTLIIYTSDHGELLGNRGLWCKSFMFEDSVGVPMIVSGPGVPAGRRCDANVNLVDVGATIAEAAGRPFDGSGESLVHRANHPNSDRVGFSEYHDGGSITGSFALRSGEWKYVRHEGFAPQLFNMVEDSDELVDRADDASASAELRRCEAQLDALVDTSAANAAAFASQADRIEMHGGRDALADVFRFNHTPVPD